MTKRLFDCLFSLLFLLIATPLLILIALSLKLSVRGPLFYGSVRYGQGKRLFTCWKFRTMYSGSDDRIENLLNSRPDLQEEWKKYRKLKKDPRVFPFGRFLRKYSLDELPQLWNVFKGEMSLVGPRPYLLLEVEEQLKERAGKILSLKPGLTGIWQTSGRNLLTFEDRIRSDEAYVDNHSLLSDCAIIFKTILFLINPKGAF
ncbi:MAG: hypothetical protein A2Y28_04220 [Chlamydiae bacterium GWC2_50_10]|nr:MAG: hypothetical protein A2Z85_04270 [Chlamydiae bacterium GWA2_50_15]OGN53712.1 MAG: hypothetical protein A2Y28_04220 [Chlamydiae bacterium GWC2_50_10]OGN58210.1 MAG: hypothetical protein A3D18_02200 [Chlamydiae bacterium RIFCSPHIGHO2_02_FULL_49_29]OGN62370.1 MAG: hypothetical protein A3E26_01720 [Chlamydiae bacterium RIFCSPHIGHO2_12_FULL_49_32]OGN68931.1 MAG: hypothetical protein A3I15_01030 [Chlamydiae bacterium RIFCSPLOWO2_02_FULL_49_12]OGN71701.1 MAG: hypothetical protein A3G30_03900 